MSARLIVMLLVATGSVIATGGARSQQRPSLAWEKVWIPAGEIRLEANVVKPAGKGPFPVVIISHGSTGKGRFPATQTLRPEFVGSEFLRHGFAVVAPMRRGRGESGGSYNEPYDCDAGLSEMGLKNAIEDTGHVVEYVRKLPYADASRMVLAGHSRGGILSVAYASQRPGVARAVVNFVGGWTSDGCSAQAGQFNEAVFAEAGKAGAARVPMLFLYADNDSYYSPASIRGFAGLFGKAGGPVVLKVYERAGRDGHSLFAHPGLWSGDLEEFLRQHNLAPRAP